MNYPDFVKFYQQFVDNINLPVITTSFEKVELVHETDWVQILLVHESPHDAEVKLVVEVSFPTWVQTLSLTRLTDEAVKDQTAHLRPVLDELILHLEYLLKLCDAGFHLGVIVEEGFWTAWTSLSAPPSQQLFATLSPPPQRDGK